MFYYILGKYSKFIGNYARGPVHSFGLKNNEIFS